MATLTSDRDPKHSDGIIAQGPVGQDIIYGGCAVVLDSTDGYLYDGNAVAANRKFAGISLEYCDNSGGSAGDKEVQYWTKGSFEFTIVGATQAVVGLPCYLLYNSTVTITPGQYAVYIGKITEFLSATKVRVKIDTTPEREANAVIPFGSTAPLRMYVGKGAFTTTGTTVAVSAGGLTVVSHASVTPVIDAGAAAANGQLGFTENASTGLPEVSEGNVTVNRIAGTDSGLKFTYMLWGY